MQLAQIDRQVRVRVTGEEVPEHQSRCVTGAGAVRAQANPRNQCGGVTRCNCGATGFVRVAVESEAPTLPHKHPPLIATLVFIYMPLTAEL